MSVIATMTVSLDGYVTGPDDGPGCGLGVGGERLHYWVMGGPWTYETDHDFDSIAAPDKQFLDDLIATMGAAVCGRNMYEAAGAWGGTNPFGGTLFVLTHRTEDAPDPSTGFVFVDGLDNAMQQAFDAAERQGRRHQRWGRHDPSGAHRRLRGRAGDHDGAGDPGRRETTLRGLRPRCRPGDPRACTSRSTRRTSATASSADVARRARSPRAISVPRASSRCSQNCRKGINHASTPRNGVGSRA